MNMMWKVVLPVLVALFAVSSGAMTGGFQDIDVNDEGMQNALNFAVVKHNIESNAVCPSEVSKVVKARRQLVSGFKYVITVNMARTACRGTSANAPYQCEFAVWSRPWENVLEVVSAKC